MKKYDTGLGPTKISMSEGPRRLGREYASPEIQLPKERDATSRNRWGTPSSLRTGQTRRTIRKLTTVTTSRGSVYAPNRPTTAASTRKSRSAIFAMPYAAAWLTERTVTDSASPTIEARPTPTSSSSHTRARGRLTRAAKRTSPLSSPRIPIDVAREERDTREPARPTASEVKSRAATAQNPNPRVELAIAPARTQPPCSRTIADSDIGSVERTGSIQGNSQPSMTPTRDSMNGGRIRIAAIPPAGARPDAEGSTFSVRRACKNAYPCATRDLCRRSLMNSALYAMLAVAFVTSVGAGLAVHALDADSPVDLVTIEGNVTAVDWNPHFNATVEVTVTVANGTNYSVELTPPWWWSENHYPAIQVNDTLKVEGILGEGNEIEAFTIWINGGDAIILRTGGMPGWAQERSGHTAAPGSNETEDGSD